ncbi:hypothetical protein R84B8_00411 [Treponema sp. R8-4-B8]
MVRNIWKKFPKLIFLTCLIFVLTGASIISAGKSLFFKCSNNGRMSLSGYSFSRYHAIDWLAGNVLIRKRTESHSNSPLQNMLLNVCIHVIAVAMAIILAGANIKIIKNNKVQIIKNLILLKLRI